MTHILYVTLALTLWLVPVEAGAQQPLPTNGPVTARTDGNEAVFQFAAPSAGVLSIVVRGDRDLTLEVSDIDGQELPDGSSDRDLFGSTGTEQLSVVIGESGMYHVQVRSLDGSSQFEIAGGWIPFPALERAPDPDGRPTRATALAIGQDSEDVLDSQSGDNQDWYVLTPTSDGVLTVVLRGAGDDVDLVLEVYLDDFGEPAERSDQDLQDDTANEAVTVNVTGGQSVHVKVVGYGNSTSGRYRLSTSFID